MPDVCDEVLRKLISHLLKLQFSSLPLRHIPSMCNCLEKNDCDKGTLEFEGEGLPFALFFTVFHGTSSSLAQTKWTPWLFRRSVSWMTWIRSWTTMWWGPESGMGGISQSLGRSSPTTWHLLKLSKLWVNHDQFWISWGLLFFLHSKFDYWFNAIDEQGRTGKCLNQTVFRPQDKPRYHRLWRRAARRNWTGTEGSCGDFHGNRGFWWRYSQHQVFVWTGIGSRLLCFWIYRLLVLEIVLETMAISSWEEFKECFHASSLPHVPVCCLGDRDNGIQSTAIWLPEKQNVGYSTQLDNTGWGAGRSPTNFTCWWVTIMNIYFCVNSWYLIQKCWRFQMARIWNWLSLQVPYSTWPSIRHPQFKSWVLKRHCLEHWKQSTTPQSMVWSTMHLWWGSQTPNTRARWVGGHMLWRTDVQISRLPDARDFGSASMSI